jgi:hypothetical protein
VDGDGEAAILPTADVADDAHRPPRRHSRRNARAHVLLPGSAPPRLLLPFSAATGGVPEMRGCAWFLGWVRVGARARARRCRSWSRVFFGFGLCSTRSARSSSARPSSPPQTFRSATYTHTAAPALANSAHRRPSAGGRRCRRSLEPPPNLMRAGAGFCGTCVAALVCSQAPSLCCRRRS